MSRLPALGPRGEGWFFLQALLLGAIAIAAWFSHTSDLVAIAAGSVLLVLGAALLLYAARAHDFAVSPFPAPAAGASLRTGGLYAFVRHPIYDGVIGASLGVSLARGSWLAVGLTVVLAVVLDLKSRREEVWLRAQYPEYAAYAARTRRFIPGLY